MPPPCSDEVLRLVCRLGEEALRADVVEDLDGDAALRVEGPGSGMA
jgi:hypothetical protein